MKMFPLDWPVASLCGIFLIYDRYEKAQLPVCSAIRVLVILGCIKSKPLVQASKQHPSIISASVPALTSFKDEPSFGNVIEINSTFPKLLLFVVFYLSNRNPKARHYNKISKSEFDTILNLKK